MVACFSAMLPSPWNQSSVQIIEVLLKPNSVTHVFTGVVAFIELVISHGGTGRGHL